MKAFPQNRYEWLRYSSVIVHSTGLAALFYCLQLSSITDPPREYFDRGTEVLAVTLSIQWLFSIGLIGCKKSLSLWSFGLSLLALLLAPMAMSISKS